MASGFVVTAAALRRLAQELRELNSQYKTKVETLASLEQELRSMWEGEANLAFQRAFANDKVNLDNFYAVIERYIQHWRQLRRNMRKRKPRLRRQQLPHLPLNGVKILCANNGKEIYHGRHFESNTGCSSG